jgi:hypothetical protein
MKSDPLEDATGGVVEDDDDDDAAAAVDVDDASDTAFFVAHGDTVFTIDDAGFDAGALFASTTAIVSLFAAQGFVGFVVVVVVVDVSSDGAAATSASAAFLDAQGDTVLTMFDAAFAGAAAVASSLSLSLSLSSTPVASPAAAAFAAAQGFTAFFVAHDGADIENCWERHRMMVRLGETFSLVSFIQRSGVERG